jgi:hypothetical protein
MALRTVFLGRKRVLRWLGAALILLAVGVFAWSRVVGTSAGQVQGVEETNRENIPLADAAHSNGSCRPGDNAALEVPRVPPGTNTKLTSKVLVLACAHVKGYGLIEIVGYDTNRAFCYATDSVTLNSSEGGLCFSREAKWNTFCQGQRICAGNVTWTSHAGAIFAQFSGRLAPSVVRVSAKWKKRADGFRAVKSVVGKIKGNLKKQLGLANNFSLFVMLFRGCPPAEGVDVLAYNARDRVIGKGNSENLLPGPCSSGRGSSISEPVMTIRAN